MLKSAFYSVQRPKYSKNRMRRLDCCCDRGWQQEYGNGVKTDTLTCSSAMNIFLNSCIAYSRSQSARSESLNSISKRGGTSFRNRQYDSNPRTNGQKKLKPAVFAPPSHPHRTPIVQQSLTLGICYEFE